MAGKSLGSMDHFAHVQPSGGAQVGADAPEWVKTGTLPDGAKTTDAEFQNNPLPGMEGVKPEAESPITKAANAGGMRGRQVPATHDLGKDANGNPIPHSPGYSKQQPDISGMPASVIAPTPGGIGIKEAPRVRSGEKSATGPGISISAAGETPESDYQTDVDAKNAKYYDAKTGDPIPETGPITTQGRTDLRGLIDNTVAGNKSVAQQARDLHVLDAAGQRAVDENIQGARESAEEPKKQGQPVRRKGGIF